MASRSTRSRRIIGANKQRKQSQGDTGDTPPAKRRTRSTGESKVPALCELNDETLLNVLKRRSGIYIISPYWHPSKGTCGPGVVASDVGPNETQAENRDPTVLVKLGVSVVTDSDSRSFRAPKSRGLEGRLDSYLLCYPLGFTLFAVFTGEAAKARPFENNFQSYLAGKGRKRHDLQHSHGEEWYDLKISEIKALQEAIRASGRKYFRSEFYCGERGRWFSATNRKPARTVRPQQTPERRTTDLAVRQRDLTTPIRTLPRKRRSKRTAR